MHCALLCGDTLRHLPSNSEGSPDAIRGKYELLQHPVFRYAAYRLHIFNVWYCWAKATSYNLLNIDVRPIPEHNPPNNNQVALTTALKGISSLHTMYLIYYLILFRTEFGE